MNDDNGAPLRLPKSILLLLLAALCAFPAFTHAETDNVTGLLTKIQTIAEQNQLEDPTTIASALNVKFSAVPWCGGTDCTGLASLGTLYTNAAGIRMPNTNVNIRYFTAEKNDPVGSKYPFLGVLVNLDFDLRSSRLCVHRADMERIFGPPPLKGSWLGGADQDIAWNYISMKTATRRVGLEFLFPEHDGCATAIQLREDSSPMSGRVKTYRDDPVARQASYGPERGDALYSGDGGAVPTLHEAERFLGKTLEEVLRQFPNATTNGRSDPESLVDAVPGTITLFPEIDGAYLAAKWPSHRDPGATRPMLDEDLVQDHALVDGGLSRWDFITYKGRVMIATQMHTKHLTMPAAIRIAELASLQTGEPGDIFQSHYNDSPDLFTAVEDKGSLALIGVVDPGGVTSGFIPSRPDEFAFIDMKLWTEYGVEARAHLANLIAHPEQYENQTRLICTPAKCPNQWRAVERQ